MEKCGKLIRATCTYSNGSVKQNNSWWQKHVSSEEIPEQAGDITHSLLEEEGREGIMVHKSNKTSWEGIQELYNDMISRKSGWRCKMCWRKRRWATKHLDGIGKRLSNLYLCSKLWFQTKKKTRRHQIIDPSPVLFLSRCSLHQIKAEVQNFLFLSIVWKLWLDFEAEWRIDSETQVAVHLLQMLI